MSWPLSHEFNEAIQNPRTAFADPDLKAAEAVVGATGLPLPRSGNFADVYQVRGADGRDWAVKCFTRPVVGLADRYARVSEALAAANLPFTVGFTFLTEGIRVGGVWRPAVKMEWVEGFQLNQVVRENAAKPTVLTALGQVWGRLCKRLREAGIAHADVQHGNVLLVPGSRQGAFGLKLIDYDGMWLPALANTPSGESGHAAFQHPARAATRAYSPDADRFPHLVVATALKGLSVAGAPLWAKYDNGDNLLFTEDDYKKPTESGLMKELWHTGDPGLQALVGRLAIACGKPLPQTPWLDQLAPEGDVAPLDDATRREAAAALGVPLPVPVLLPPEPSYPGLPPEPGSAPAPMIAPAAGTEAGDEVDVELVEPTRPSGKKKADRDPKPHAGGVPAWMWITGGALVLAVVAVAAVLFSGGKKPQETVQEPPAPAAKSETPKAPAQNPKPKEKTDPPAKDKTPDPVVPPAPETVQPQPYEAPAGEPPALKPRWTADVPHFCEPLAFTLTGRSLFAGSSGRGGAALDVATGGRREPFADLLKAPSAALFPLTDGRVGAWPPGAFTISLWNDQTGERMQKLDFPNVPRPAEGGFLHMRLSRDARYAAAGWVRYQTQSESNLALRVFDLTNNKAVLSFDWAGGYVYFTADAARVLVAEFTGRCRWFKLPSGEPDGEWGLVGSFGEHRVTGISDDGTVLAYYGSHGRKGGIGGATIDGKTGAVLRVLAPTRMSDRSYLAVISGDGRRIAVPWADAQGNRVYDVSDLRTGALIGRITTGSRQCSATFSPDGTALGLSVGGTKPSVQLFDCSVGAVSPTAPVAPPELKVRWTAPTGDLTTINRLYVSPVDLAVAVSNTGKGAAFDLSTGKPRTAFTPLLARTYGATFFPLDNQRVAVASSKGNDIRVWDERTGEELPKLTVPDLPAAEGDGPPRVFVAPNARYVAAGHLRAANAPPDTELALRVFDVTTQKPVVSVDWTGGSVYFTADSARVLVAELNGRCRWFKLPSGEPDGAWEFERVTGGRRHDVTSMSADGALLGYTGPAGRGPNAFGPAVLDGKTGKPVHLFSKEYYAVSRVALATDGKRAAVIRSIANETSTCDVVDARTGAVLGRAVVAAGASIPPFALARDGTLVVLAPRNKTLHVFEPDAVAPVAKSAPVPEPELPPLAAKWTTECKTKLDAAVPHFTDDGQTLALVATTGPVAAAAFNVRTRAAGKELVAPPKRGPFHHLFALDKTKFAIQSDIDKELLVWEPLTGKTSLRTFPPPAVPGGVPSVNVSPDGRYLTVGSARPAPGLKSAETPLRVIDTVSNKPVVTLDWHAGATAFTADSTRVLVVDDTDKFRWFKLPAGQPDGEWAFDRAPDGKNARLMGTSARGEVVLHYGRPPGKDETVHLLDGKDGTVLHSFPAKRHLDTGGSVSDDGKSVLLITHATADGTHWAEFFDARGMLFAAVKLPSGDRTVAVSWKARVVATYDRAAQRVTTYDLPAPRAP